MGTDCIGRGACVLCANWIALARLSWLFDRIVKKYYPLLVRKILKLTSNLPYSQEIQEIRTFPNFFFYMLYASSDRW